MKYPINKILLTSIIGVVMSLTGCSKTLSYYTDTEPKFDIQAFFDGKIKAWGIVQDFSGKATTRFDVEMVGSWNGNVGTLEEDFVFYDGKTQKRIWTITKLPDGTYEGTASDILDKAIGNQNGSAMNWIYVMDLPVGDTTYRLKFDDWMWQMNDGVVINRSYMKKFGVTVAELTLFMQKQPE